MTRLIHAVLLSYATLAVAKDGAQRPATAPIINQMTSQGCFSKLPAGAERAQIKTTYLTTSECADACTQADKFVAVLHAASCHCADTYPPESALVDDKQCNYPCPGYPQEACGGSEAYSIFNTGLEIAVDNDPEGAVTSAKNTTTAATTSTSSIRPPSTPSAKAPTTTAAGNNGDGTNGDSTNGAQSTPSSTATDIPSNAAPRLSSPVGKLVRMAKILFN
ncbi:hypothetical protein ACHAPT_012550 [Fusarium lateritium]